jgi:putative heme-binding domain-containing protein
LFCGGIRNSYDLVFNGEGDLFFHDSDMEFDVGSPWYRPTQVFQAVPGGEYGWRSGWAKWPNYFIDCLPAVIETGRGSPTGGVVYDHYMFPRRFHNALFLADWSEGRILAVTLKPDGASYSANSEVFLSGSPLNVTDVDVGPEGALYFITGGRGTSGGVYRVSWRGTVPPAVQNLGQGISRAIRHPQLQSAWARQDVAVLKDELGGQWEKLLIGVASSTVNPPQYRIRALDLMQLFGPPPSQDLLVVLSQDKSELVRAKAAELMGLHSNLDTQRALVKLLDDSDRAVRRKACEALCRAEQTAPVKKVIALLKSDDRYETWAARRLLERAPVQDWREQILTTNDHRVFIHGSLALLITTPDHDTALDIVDRMSELMEGFVSDRDFIDMIRIAQVAMHRGDVTPEEVPELKDQLSAEFPAGNDVMNREIVRVLAYLQATEPMDRYFEYLDSDVPESEKLHLALHLRFLESGWTLEHKLQLLSYYERAQKLEGGGSYPFYIRYFERDFAKMFSDEESREVIASGEKYPSAALGALYKLPEHLDDAMREQLIELDRRLVGNNSESVKALRVGLVAIFARSGDEASMNYMRTVWDSEPERRQSIAMGLAQSPDGENWSYLVRSIPSMEGPALREILQKLLTVAKAPAEAEYIRQAILAGLKLKENGADDAFALLEYWTSEQPASENAELTQRLEAWQKWFAETYPDFPEAKLPVAKEGSKWQMDELLQYLSSEESTKASAEKGAQVFAKAQCIKCHRFGDRGESLGPDLSTLSSRFMRREALESILFPSHVISDQYSSKVVVTRDGKSYTGVVVTNGNIVTILQSNGDKQEVAKDDVEETHASRTSIMPENLMDDLKLEDIANLFAYLGYRAPPDVARRSISSQR